MEFNDSTPKNVLERLTFAEHLVVELKDIIRQKDDQLQQKDEVLQEEQKAAESKIKKLKLHAKAKVTALNRQIEEMKAQGKAVLPAKSQPEESLSTLNNSSTEMEEFVFLKQQLQEKEKLISTLQAQLSQIQAEQAAQLSSMQQVVREKDARFETQVRLHEDELLQLVTQADVETEMQQNLKVLQRKLEEHEEALLGRAQVVDLLQQELTMAEQRNQMLSQQLQLMEAECHTLKNTVETERQESKTLMEKIELEVAERKLSFHNQQEEMRHLLGQVEQAGHTQAELQARCAALEQEHRAEIEEKTAHILSLQKTEQELHLACAALKDENSKLLQDKNEQAAQSAQAIRQLEDQLQQKSEEISQFLNKPIVQKHEIESQTSFPGVYAEDTQAATEETLASLQKRVVELESEKGDLLHCSVELEELKAENEKLSSRMALLEAQNRSREADSEMLSQQLQLMEAEYNILKNTVETERQEFKTLMEKMELEVAERKLSFHNLQEEMHRLLGQVEQAGHTQAELQARCAALEQEHRAEIEEKTAHILSLQKTEQELQLACAALKDENSKLLQDKNEQAAQSAQAIRQLEDQLQQKSEEISQLLNKPTVQKHEIESQTSFPDVYTEDTQISMVDNTMLKNSYSFLEESGQDVLENSFSQKHKELSVLLLEMKEAQEEIAFLKLQLQGKRVEGDHEVLAQKETRQTENEGLPPVKMQAFLENTAQDFPLMPGQENTIPAIEKEEQGSTKHQNRTSEEIASSHTGVDDVEKPLSAAPAICQCHQDELERLKSQILELETSFQRAEENFEKNLDEKALEISNLNQQIEEFKKKAKDTSSALTALSAERDQLLSQVKELNVLPELRAQVKELDASLADSERQRRLDCEHQMTQQNLLTEQIHSLGVEAKSKDVKIEALQKELDDVQLQFSEQSVLVRSLESQLQKKEDEVLAGAERVRGISHKMEELAQALSQKELEIAKMDQLLLEKKRDVETLQHTIEEKDQQVTEISFSMTEKVVQLNEEKFSLGVEIKTLKEQLNLLSRAEEAKKEQAAEDNGVISGLKHNYDESGPAGRISKEELQHELDHLKKESEQRKRKLHAALINRKELLQRISALEQTISEKEMELQLLRKDMEEKTAAEEQLQAIVQQMNQNLQDKTNQIDSLQGQIMENEALIQKLTKGAKDAGDGDSAVVSSPPDKGSGEHWRPEMEQKILDLEKEKEHLQKKLQEALASRKAILKKVQEKERHFREELQQQKDDYDRLQEQFGEQSREKEHVGDQLRQLQRLISLKEEEVSHLSGQLTEKEEAFTKAKKEIIEQEDLIKALHTQLEMQAREYEERMKQLQVELCELKQKPGETAEENRAKQQVQRKLQAALISRKELLKENKSLQEELSLARDTVEHLTKSLTDMESQISAQNKEKDTVLGRVAVLQEERDKLITEMDKSLLENQSLSGSCESLKLALEGLTKDKENLVKDIEALRCSKIAESTEWQEKHKELQNEYEILLQSYENVSNEAERIQHVVETVRHEKQELYSQLRSVETSKKETEKQLQEAEQEMEEMKEKMRKFAKSKQQKILELEEENDRLRTEAQPADTAAKESLEALCSSNNSMKEELERVRTEYDTLSKEFEALMSEKDALSEELRDLKHQIEDDITKKASLEATEKPDSHRDVTGESTQPVPGEAQETGLPSGSTKPEDSEAALLEDGAGPDISENFGPRDEINSYLQQIDQLQERVAKLEGEKQQDRELGQALENEKNALLSQISSKDSEIKMLQEEVTQTKLLNQQVQEELTRVTKLKEATEEEKDDLEERLMNQLAELNGSIGNYYQDVTDAQIKNELLESEMQNLKKCMSELEEEKEQLVKEKTKVESEIRKEYLEKIQGAQKGPGNKSHTKELQELLKEKQQEVKQLQKDCIRYQEKISALEKTVKALEFVQTESQKDLEITKENLAQAVEHRRKTQAELASFKVVLDDTQSEAARVLADNFKLKRELQSSKESVKSQMKQKDEDFERRLEQAEEKHLKEEKNMQEKLDALHTEKIHLEETLGEIQVALNKKDQEMKQLQKNLDSTVAQLAAFSKSMSSLQDDRDRVMDEAKKWERKFADAIQTKEEEIRLKEENCSVLKDQLRQASIHMEELKISLSRLEHDKQIWESRTQTEVQQQQKIYSALQEENKELLSQLEETRHLYHNSQDDLAKLESELQSVRDQATDLNNSLEGRKEHEEKLEGIIKQQETDIQNCKFSYEQLENDLRAARELTSRLHEEINMKEQKIISLLSGKEDAIQAAVAELHQQHDKEIKELENLLSQEEEENIVLEEENKKAVEKTNQLMETLKTTKKENIQQKAQLDSFVKSMSSLQNDRDRIMNDYQQLEERHLSIILEKDQLIQDAAAENNKLKEEIRGLRSHMDDLNSENAKLDAELIQYREDLNQVISIKDCQQKQLIEVQLQQNKELKNECAKLEEQLKESQEAKESLQRSSVALQEEKQGLSEEIENLKGSVSQLKKQVTALQEEGALGMCHAELKVKEEDIQRLNAMLASSQKRIKELEDELVRVQKEASRKVGEIEDKLKKELKHLHHDAGIMRNETETAEERVAELARDLVEMEQKLLVVTKENKDLTAQIQSFGKSMSSLQNSRDHVNEELDDLRRKYDASLKELAQLREQKGFLNRESEVLSQAVFQVSATEENGLSHLEKLNQQLISKDEQLLHMSSQLEESYNQVQSFSKAMASLQNERDHLWNELKKFQKSEEGKQMSAAQTASSTPEVQSLKKAMSSLQNDRDRLLKELKNLQQQYLQINQEVTELRPMKAQLQEYQDKTETFQLVQEQLRQENLSWQHELHQLRMDKSSWEMHERRLKEQYLMAISDKDQQLSHMQNLMRELRSSSQTQTLKVQYQRQVFPETSASLDGSQDLVYETELLRTQLNDSLKEIHQKELRFQQLNSKFSQLLEEKNTLSIQLCNTSQSLRENQQHYSDLFNHCAVLEKKMQEFQAGPLNVHVAQGAPLEMIEVHRKSDAEEARESQQSAFEAQQQLCNTKQEVNKLRKLLEEERDQRMAAEDALSVAEEQIRRMELGEWDSVRTPIIGSCGTQEQTVLIDVPGNSCRRTRSGAGWKRLLRSLCHSRTRVPLLAAGYLLTVHVLLILCITGLL